MSYKKPKTVGLFKRSSTGGNLPKDFVDLDRLTIKSPVIEKTNEPAAPTFIFNKRHLPDERKISSRDIQDYSPFKKVLQTFEDKNSRIEESIKRKWQTIDKVKRARRKHFYQVCDHPNITTSPSGVSYCTRCSKVFSPLELLGLNEKKELPKQPTMKPRTYLERVGIPEKRRYVKRKELEASIDDPVIQGIYDYEQFNIAKKRETGTLKRGRGENIFTYQSRWKEKIPIGTPIPEKEVEENPVVSDIFAFEALNKEISGPRVRGRQPNDFTFMGWKQTVPLGTPISERFNKYEKPKRQYTKRTPVEEEIDDPVINDLFMNRELKRGPQAKNVFGFKGKTDETMFGSPIPKVLTAPDIKEPENPILNDIVKGLEEEPLKRGRQPFNQFVYKGKNEKNEESDKKFEEMVKK